MIGPTFACVVGRQFQNLRRGDRFWFENPNLPSSFTPGEIGLHCLSEVCRIFSAVVAISTDCLCVFNDCLLIEPRMYWKSGECDTQKFTFYSRPPNRKCVELLSSIQLQSVNNIHLRTLFFFLCALNIVHYLILHHRKNIMSNQFLTNLHKKLRSAEHTIQPMGDSYRWVGAKIASRAKSGTLSSSALSWLIGANNKTTSRREPQI